jgi:hypothetical protein
MDEYLTVAGIIQFEPRTRQAKDKTVRDIAVKAIGNNKLVNITVWPEKDNINLAKGDFIVADGLFKTSTGQNKNGEQQTYYNLSANTLINFGGESGGGTTSTTTTKKADEPTSGDDFPF